MRITAVFLFAATLLAGAERATPPTFLYRNIGDVQAKPSDITTDTCRYKPVFGAGGAVPGILRGVARFGEAEIDSGGSSKPVVYPNEEQIYYVTEGSGTIEYGEEKSPIRKEDFMYIPAGVKNTVSAAGGKLRYLIMGFRLPANADRSLPPKLLIANISEVKKEVVGGHPPSTLYQLLIGDTKSTRDKIAAGRVVTSLFIMNFAPGGTNFPHAHDSEEEIYLVLDGQGDMVAGGGVDGVENRRPAKAGDAYCYRLNTTVGFYNRNEPGAISRILAVRSTYPRRQRP